jgi:hypothetical protein
VSVLSEIRDLALEWAIAEQAKGETESGGQNMGPMPRRYLKSVGLPEGHPWCCAAVVTAYDVACGVHQMQNVLPRTGKVVRMWQECPIGYLRPDPVRGCLVGHASQLDDDDSKGHVGWCVDYRRTAGQLYTLEGNTNAAGSRNGDRWGYHWRPLSYWNLGCIDVGFSIP